MKELRQELRQKEFHLDSWPDGVLFGDEKYENKNMVPSELRQGPERR